VDPQLLFDIADVIEQAEEHERSVRSADPRRKRQRKSYGKKPKKQSKGKGRKKQSKKRYGRSTDEE